MIKCDVAIIGYAVNSTSGGYTNRDVKYLDTVGIKYLYSHFYGTYCAEPVAFLQLAAELRNRGIETHILDGLLLGYNVEEMKQKLLGINTNIYCFSLYESSKDDVIELMKFTKGINPKAIIITGGPYVTLCYKELMETESIIDYITIGDSDVALPELVKRLLHNNLPQNIPNVVRRDSQGNVITDVSPKAIDMDNLCALERDFADIIFEKGFSLSIASSRGCGYAACSFCYLKQYQLNSNQPKFRYRSPQLVVDEIKELVRKYNIQKLTFVDDDFFGTNSKGIARAIELFRLLIKENIKINLYLNARVASVKYIIEHNLLDLASRAGLKYLFIGFESYNNEILDRYHKGITTNDIDLICEELKKKNILINPGMITFDTYITPSQVKRNVDLLHKIKYYDLFMFTRTLMNLPSESQGIKDNRVKKGQFVEEATEKLYELLVDYRDKVYPIYADVQKNKITDAIRGKIIDEHFSLFYEIYNALNNSDIALSWIINKHVDRVREYLKTTF